MSCRAPKLPAWSRLCPYVILSSWVRIWDRAWGPQHVESPFFFLARKTTPVAPSYDSFRKVLRTAAPNPEIGTHSLRKGGAWWYKHVALVPPEVIQSQGGWKSSTSMESSYVAFTSAQRREKLLDLASRAPAP